MAMAVPWQRVAVTRFGDRHHRAGQIRPASSCGADTSNGRSEIRDFKHTKAAVAERRQAIAAHQKQFAGTKAAADDFRSAAQASTAAVPRARLHLFRSSRPHPLLLLFFTISMVLGAQYRSWIESGAPPGQAPLVQIILPGILCWFYLGM